jgi:hypothetical protein
MRPEIVERLADVVALVALTGDPDAVAAWATRHRWSTAEERTAGAARGLAFAESVVAELRAIRRAEVEDGLHGDAAWCELHGIAP